MTNLVGSIASPVTVTSTGTTTPTYTGWDAVTSAVIQLRVTAAATAAGDLLDVYLETSADGGTTWNDWIHFTQVLGNGGAKTFEATWVRHDTPTRALGAAQVETLADGVNQGPIGRLVRERHVVTSASAPSFTYSVVMDAHKN